MICREHPLEIDNCTFVNNHGEPEECNVAFTGGGEGGTPIHFNSCIIRGEQPHFWNPELIEVVYSHIAGGWNGTGNSDDYPGFFGMGPDMRWGLLSGNSPCIDTADPDNTDDPDITRADRGWMYYPNDVLEALSSDTLHARASLGERIDQPLHFTNETEAVIMTSPAESWGEGARLQIINVSSITDDDEIHGVTYFDGKYYLSGGNNDEDPNMIYVLDEDFDLVDSFEQPGAEDGTGFRGMAVDDLGFMFAVDSLAVVEFSTEGELGRYNPDPAEFDSYNAIAIDSRFADGFYNAFIAGDEGIIAVTDDEMFVDYFFDIGPPIKGLAMKKSAPLLYAVTEAPDNSAHLNAVDIDSGRATPLFQLTPPGEGYRAGGIDITHELSDGKGTIVGIWETEGADRMYIFDLYTTWLSVNPRWHLMMPGDSALWNVTFSAEEIDPGDYYSDFYLLVNGSGEDGEIPAHLTVNPYSVEQMDNIQPTTARINALYPNPFNATTRVEYQLQTDGWVTLKLFDLNGREVRLLAQGVAQAGLHSAVIEAADLPAGQYFVKLTSGQVEEVKSFVIVK